MILQRLDFAITTTEDERIAALQASDCPACFAVATSQRLISSWVQ